jgi:serine/threonine-protein kinase
VLYECLAGKVPFQGETDADTALARLQRDPTDLTRLRPTLPGGLVDVITKLVQREPDDRFATGAEVRAALAKALATPEPAIDVPGTPTQSPTPVATPPPSTKVARPTGRSDRTPSSSHYPRAPRDRTPPAPRRRPPPPKMQQKVKPSLVVVGGLLVLAIVMVIVLWAAARTQGDGGGSDTTTATGGAVAATGFDLYDPQGDGLEKDRNPILADGGVLSAPWQTLCYRTADFSEKDGIGLIVQLSGVADGGQLHVIFGTQAWKAELYAIDGPAPAPTDKIDVWGDPIATASSADMGAEWTAPLTVPANRLLVFLREGGQDSSCTSGKPYLGRINAITFSAA